MKQWQYRRLCETSHSQPGQRLYIQTGKQKGKYGKFSSAYDSKITILLDVENIEHTTHYTSIEEVDEFGQPKILPVMDMTGREIALDSYICYSVKSGQYSHALEIGKVFEFTKVGAIKVRAVVRNGEKIEPQHWRRNEVTVNDPFRAIKLPVDPTTMLMWIMQDFDELAMQK